MKLRVILNESYAGLPDEDEFKEKSATQSLCDFLNANEVVANRHKDTITFTRGDGVAVDGLVRSSPGFEKAHYLNRRVVILCDDPGTLFDTIVQYRPGVWLTQ